jgi:ATP-dependent exoDNAse (exonuclease V) beta subunit
MVHELFAEVEWGGPAVIGPLSKEWAARGFSAEAVGEALACLQAPELARVWARIQNAELWRERAFEIVLDGAWLTGVCDRVLVERDGSGRAIRAAVFDFKTDRVKTDAEVADAAERHAAQLNIYRRVIARLARLPVASVTGELVFTRLRRLVRVGGEISRS